MKQALFVLSGVAFGLATSLVAVLTLRADFVPKAEAQAGPASGGAAGVTVLGTGGGTQNQNDLCWVLSRIKPARGPERTVLALYRAKRNGECFDLEDVRMVEADFRVIELKGDSHTKNTTVQEILKKLPPEERDSILPRNP
jgi:hypothetical protein